MDQLAAGRGGRGSEIGLLNQRDFQAAPRGVAGNARAVYAAADHEQVAVAGTEIRGIV